MKILIDECLPSILKKRLFGHEFYTVSSMGWNGIKNGLMLIAAEKEGFDLLLTADGKMRGQQNLAGRNIAVLAIPSNNQKIILTIIEQIQKSLEDIEPGIFYHMQMEGAVSEWEHNRRLEIEKIGNTHIRKYTRDQGRSFE